MNIKNIKKFSRISICLVLVSLIFPLSAQADSEIVKSENGSYSVTKPIFTYGTSLTSEQLAQTKKELNVDKDEDNVKIIVITGDDLVKWLPDLGFSSKSGVWSSSYIMPDKAGSGVKVRIVTPGNITSYSSDQYGNVLTSLGVTDVKVNVGSNVKVDGSGAMGGIYKALANQLPKNQQEDLLKNAKIAQEELTTIGEISDANKNKGFDKKFNLAVADMKDGLQQETNNGKQQLSAEEILKIVTSALEKQNLQNLVSDKQQQSLVNFLQNFQKSPANSNEKLHKQLKALKNSINGSAREVMSKAKDVLSSKDAKGILQKIGDALKGFFKKIKDIFSGK